MPTRQDIKESFLAELDAAVSGLSQSVDTGLQNNDSSMSLPYVSYTEIPFTVSYNDGSKNEYKDADYDTAGNVTTVYYPEHSGLSFHIDIRAPNEQDKEPIYEAVLRHFLAFENYRPDTDLHAGVDDITVIDMSDGDDPSRESTLRGDDIRVEVEYIRMLSRSVDPMDVVGVELDIENDGDVEFTFNED